MTSSASLIDRTKQFWIWFSENEEKLSKIIQDKNGGSEAGCAFISEGVSLIANDIYFNIGGDYEFTFSINANSALFFIFPYVTANMPEQYRDKWKFFSCMQGTGGKSFGFRMYETEVEIETVRVSVMPNEDGKTASLRFYAKEWKTLPEQECYNAFYTLLDLSVGEALANTCLNEVERADSFEDGMFSLSKLEQWMLDNLCEDGKVPNPADRFFAYKMQPQEGMEPRRDIIIGGGSYAPILNEYLDGEDNCYQTFAKFGVKPIFLYFYYDEQIKERADVLSERNAIMDKLEEEVLGERGSGNEIGLMLGSAMGESRVYIDLLLYDERIFIEKARKLLVDFPYMVLAKEFYTSGREFVLTDHTVDGFKERLNQLHEAGAHKEIIKISEAMPSESMDFTLTNLYARALNNDDQEAKAVEVLESIREQGESDALWNWRMGFALYYLDRDAESIPYLKKAIELGDDKPETAELLQKAIKSQEDK